MVLSQARDLCNLPPIAYVREERARLHLALREELQKGASLPVKGHQGHSETSPLRILDARALHRDKAKPAVEGEHPLS